MCCRTHPKTVVREERIELSLQGSKPRRLPLSYPLESLFSINNCMKAATVLLSLLLFMRSTLAGWDQWSQTDRELFIASSIAMAADWSTTRYATRRWDTCKCRETNPILGPFPSTARLDAYFVLLLATNYVVGSMLPDEYRGMYFTVRTVSHGWAAHHNMTEFGWRMRF